MTAAPVCPGCLKPYSIGQPHCACGRPLESIGATVFDASALPVLTVHGPPPPRPGLALRVEGGQAVRVRGGVSSLVEVGAKPMLIGRRDAVNGVYPDIDLGVLSDYGYTSRRHALVVVQGEQLVVTHLPADPTTAVNDPARPLTPNAPTPLSAGDRLIIGERVVFEVVAIDSG